jgi:hypothetical protein
VFAHRDQAIGFLRLIGDPSERRLESMFLEPRTIGHGYGRVMWPMPSQQRLTSVSAV